MNGFISESGFAAYERRHLFSPFFLILTMKAKDHHGGYLLNCPIFYFVLNVNVATAID